MISTSSADDAASVQVKSYCGMLRNRLTAAFHEKQRLLESLVTSNIMPWHSTCMLCNDAQHAALVRMLLQVALENEARHLPHRKSLPLHGIDKTLTASALTADFTSIVCRVIAPRHHRHGSWAFHRSLWCHWYQTSASLSFNTTFCSPCLAPQ
jgi:hypothetical protein